MALARKVLDRAEIKRILGSEETEVYSLDAHGRKLRDISDLSTLPRLRCLDVSWNGLRAVRHLDGLKQLRDVRASNNAIEEVDVARCRLETLDLHDNQLSQAPELPKTLRTLSLARNQITNLRPLAHATLTHLDLSGNSLTSIASVLSNLASLTELDLSRNEIRDVPQGALDACRATLLELRLGDNLIADVTEEEKSLTKGTSSKKSLNSTASETTKLLRSKLNQQDENIKRVKAGAKVADLKATTKVLGEETKKPLIAQQQKTERTIRTPLEGLRQLTTLRTLALPRNQITRTAVLPRIGSLAELDLQGNRVETIEGISAAFPKLDVIHLGGNRLADLGAVVEGLKDLTDLAELHLAGNPCATRTTRLPTSRPTTSDAAPGWAVVCARALPKLQVLDDLRVDDKLTKLDSKHAKGLEKLEPLADVEPTASAFRRSLDDVKSSLKQLRAAESHVVSTRPRTPLDRALNFSNAASKVEPSTFLAPATTTTQQPTAEETAIDLQLSAEAQKDDYFDEEQAPVFTDVAAANQEDDDLSSSGSDNDDDDLATYLAAVESDNAVVRRHESMIPNNKGDDASLATTMETSPTTTTSQQQSPDVAPEVDDDSDDDDVLSGLVPDEEYAALLSEYQAALGSVGIARKESDDPGLLKAEKHKASPPPKDTKQHRRRPGVAPSRKAII